MRAKSAVLCCVTFFTAMACAAQNAPQSTPASAQPGYSDVNCAGFITDQRISEDIHVISGEQPGDKIIFSRGDLVYIDRGQDKGVRVGDRFSVMRPEKDPMQQVNWFKWQTKLLKAMGTQYADEGQLRVVTVQPKVSIAEVTFSCNFLQRGDIVVAYVDRPTPSFKDPAPFDHFAPVSGKPVAMIVGARDHVQSAGRGMTTFVNLGASQGVKVGDYFRIFRYQGSLSEAVPQLKGYQYKVYGYGSAPVRYTWKDLPREVLGEGIVLNVSRNSSTVLITYTRASVFNGDYVELE